MGTSKLNRKYYGYIWLALIFASYVRGAFGIYQTIADMISSHLSAADAAPTAFVLILEGPLSAAITYICALVVWSIGARLYVRSISRNDFCYWTMLFAAAAKFVVGVINIFGILDPAASVFADYVLQPLLINAAMLCMFFLVICRFYNLNPVEKYNAFRAYAMIFFIAEGLVVAYRSADPWILASAAANPLFAGLFADAGYTLVVDISTLDIAAIITGACVYIAYVISAIVVGALLNKRRMLFRDPETRGDYYASHADPIYAANRRPEDVFGDLSSDPQPKKEKEKVFEDLE